MSKFLKGLICPVTLCVLGHYPKYIYIKKVAK